MPSHLSTIDSIIDSNRLYLRTSRHRWSLARRTGRTKRWDTLPTSFSIPVRIGHFRYELIDEESFDPSGNLLPQWRVLA